MTRSFLPSVGGADVVVVVAVELVADAVVVGVDRVVALLGEDPVRAGADEERVVALVALDEVVVAVAVDDRRRCRVRR